jgi:hypothetical protein
LRFARDFGVEGGAMRIAAEARRCALMLCFSGWWSAAFAADIPRMVYSKSFPGSVPAYVEIAIDSSGAGSYKEAADDDAETFKLDPAVTKEMFDLAEKLERFSHPLESGLKVANMGVKTFRWEEGSKKTEVKFNYSLDENAKALHDWFEKITESERLYFEFRRAVRHDKLGVNEAIVNIQASWERKRLAPAEQFLPLLDQVAKNDVFMHMSRERAAQLADAIRAAKKI